MSESHTSGMLITQQSQKIQWRYSVILTINVNAPIRSVDNNNLTFCWRRLFAGPNYNYFLSWSRTVAGADPGFARRGHQLIGRWNVYRKLHEKESRPREGGSRPQRSSWTGQWNMSKTRSKVPIVCNMVFPLNANLRIWLISWVNSDILLSI